MIGLPALRSQLAGAPVLLWLLVLAVCARALVPVGYMPDGAALRDGRVALALCAASGPIPAVYDASVEGAAPAAAHGEHAGHAGHHVHPTHGHAAAQHAGHGAQAHHDESQAALSCPFWLAAQQALHPPMVSVPALVLQLATLPGVVPPAPVSLRPAPTGPPLGSRAPPSIRI